MSRAIAALLLAVAAIHFLPVAGVLGADRLATLYGVTVADPALELLLRHRAVLFGIVGALLVAGALHRPLRAAAIAGGFASVISFLVIAAGRDHGEAIGRVVLADWLALALLILATLLALAGRRRARPIFRGRMENAP